jgi:hypothetical protein
VQGSEKSALRGAAELLEDTSVVICEADIDDFQDINDLLREKDFILYDVTTLNYATNGTLCWFYPVYINRSLNSVLPKSFWDAAFYYAGQDFNKDGRFELEVSFAAEHKQIQRFHVTIANGANVASAFEPRAARSHFLLPVHGRGSDVSCRCQHT